MGTAHERCASMFATPKNPRQRVVHSKFASWRWGSIVSVISDLLVVAEVLPVVWSLQKYQKQHKGAAQDEPPADDNAYLRAQNEGPDITAVDAAIRSPTFWLCARMVLALNAFGEDLLLSQLVQ